MLVKILRKTSNHLNFPQIISPKKSTHFALQASTNSSTHCLNNNSIKMKNTFNKKTKGMTFIEVLVALFILVTGILGAVAMQASAKKGSFDAMQRSVASSVAQDIIERIRSNSAATTVLTTYVGTYGASALATPAIRCNTTATLCTPAQMVTNDLYEWTETIRGSEAKIGAQSVGGLVNAIGCITQAGQVINVTISWEGRTETTDGGTGSCGSSSTKRRQLTLTAFIF